MDIGKPTATRAVAAANGANRVAIIIPCHRIIGKDGSMTGYGGGIARKIWLINHEATIRKNAADFTFRMNGPSLTFTAAR
jgi:AraC family transcriptional regulator of adaptative response/methylated-DNA-[protein]-cysteine methyltransferase